MTISSWLKNWSSAAVRRKRNTPVRAVASVAEHLELRSLLSASVLVIGTELNITLSLNDSVSVSSVSGAVVVQIGANGGNLLPVALGGLSASAVQAIIITGGEEGNSINLSGVLAADFTSLASINVNGGNGDDSILGSNDFADNLFGDDGRDTLDGQGGDDTLDGEDGADLITGSTGNDSIDGGDGADTIDAGTGNDTVNAGNGADGVVLGDGNDVAGGANGDDTISGGLGDDSINGDGGTDVINGDAGNDSILGGEKNDTIDGGDGNDTISGQAGGDLIDGGAGTDSLLGNGGNDRLRGGDDDDFVNGGTGNDTLEGGLGNDKLLGGANNDLIYDDFESGNASFTGNDTLLGQGGDDTMLALGGADYLDGGAGNDLVDNRTASISIADARLDPEGSNGGTTNMVFTVTLSTALTRTVSVDFATSNGTATSTVNGTTPQDNFDYVPTTGTVTFAPGETVKTLNVPIVGDTFGESSEETLNVNLSNSFNASIFDGSGEGRIVDDDAQVGGPIDVLLLIDDTGSFQGTGPEILTAFPLLIAQLQQQFPGQSLAFGVSRFQEYQQNNNPASPFVLNQPIIVDSTANFQSAINAALNRVSTVSGGSQRNETAYEALHQIATGVGLDYNGNGTTLDNGAAGLISTQSAGGGTSGDVPLYSSFQPDPTGPVLSPTVPVATSTDGVGFRSNAQHLVILASDAFGWDLRPDNLAQYTGVGGVTLPAAQVLVNPQVAVSAAAATVQNTFNELIAQNIQVITLAPNQITRQPVVQGYRAISQLSGAVNQTTGNLENNITAGPSADDIQPGQPLYFQIPQGNPVLLATTLANAITGASVAPTPPPPPPPPPPPVFTGPQGDTITMGEGDDTVFGGEFNDIINGGSGNDSLDGGEGDDTIFGGSGNDVLLGNVGDDTLNGQAGNDTLDGGAGDDTIIWEGASGGNDLLGDTSGDNTLRVNGNANANAFVISESANDLLVVSEGSKSVTVGPTFNQVIVDGGNGNDTITIQSLLDVPSVALSVLGGNGNDLLTAAGASLGNVRLLLSGNAGNDTLVGSEDSDTLSGDAGNDNLYGNGGDDTASGGDGNDNVYGGAGNDSLQGNAGDDSLRGNDGNDTADGGDGFDVLLGQAGNDSLLGGAGDDSLDGSAGNDTLGGDLGIDTLSGGDGDDSLDGGRNDDLLSGGIGNDTLRGDHGNDSIDAGDGDDQVIGGDGNDSIIGGLGNDAINGSDGDDIINGGAGNDTLLGGDGADTLGGGGGTDVILGGDGDDSLNGQGGTDTIAGNQGVDVIADPANEIDETFTLSTELLTALEAI